MRCIDEGAAQALIDGEPVAAAISEHAGHCAVCTSRLEVTRERAGNVTALLACLQADTAGFAADAAAALERVRDGFRSPRLRPGSRLAWAAAAALLLALALTPPGQAIAQRLLSVFRVERITAIRVPSPPPDLSALAVKPDKPPLPPKPVSRLDEIIAAVGFRPLLPSPGVLAGEPRLLTLEPQRYEQTIDTGRIQRALEAAGRAPAAIPPELDGVHITLEIGRAAVAAWGNCPSVMHPPPGCVVLAQVPAPAMTASRPIDFHVAVALALQVAGIEAAEAERIARQLGGVPSALLAFAGADAAASEVALAAGPATLIRRGQSRFDLIWSRGGRIYQLLGHGDDNFAVRVADSLR